MSRKMLLPPRMEIRDISPMLKKLRNFLLGREHTLALRFQDEVATRNPELPNIPGGPSHKLSNNYYFARDGRREVKPPMEVKTVKMLGAGAGAPSLPVSNRRPGNPFRWDAGPDA